MSSTGTPVADRVVTYLRDKASAHREGTAGYYAIEALRVALDAFRGGNYGIGAIAVVRREGAVYEYRAGNTMVSGEGLVDHAETQALLRVATGDAPDREYPAPADIGDVLPEDGIAVFGTLEPCPMCAVVMTNAGVSLSVSTVEDGQLVLEGDYRVSDGAANVLGDKYDIQPRIWRQIQQGRGLRFEKLDVNDPELLDLSQAIFVETRGQIDKALADRPPKDRTAAIRDGYELRSTTVATPSGDGVPPAGDDSGTADGPTPPPPFRSSFLGLYTEIVTISPSVPGAIARVVAYEDQNDLATPRVYVSTAITSGGYRRNNSLSLNEVISRNNHAALLIADELQANKAPHVTPYEVMLPVELGKVQGWKDTDYLLFYFAWLGGLTETGAAWLVEKLDEEAYREIRETADDRSKSNEERWPNYEIFADAAITQLAVAATRRGGKRSEGADLLLQLIDFETSLGCRAEQLFADARGLDRLAPTFGTGVRDALDTELKALEALDATVGARRNAAELIPLSLP